MATKKKSNVKGWEIGAGITAATIAAAAGAYLLSDKKTKAKAKKWVASARREVVKNAKTARRLGQKEYGRMVDQAVKRYGSLEKMNAAQIMAAAKEMKGDWNKIQAHAKKMAKAHRPAKKAVKKSAAKRASRKTSKKSRS
jgi:hypothetical protein